MQRAVVPSPDFWTVTPFEVDVPDGWSARPTVDHLVYLDVADEPGTNCGITWRRVSPQLELRQLAGMNLAAIKRLDPNARLEFSKFVRINGFAAYLRLCQFDRTRDGATVRSGQVYAAIHGPFFGKDRPIELFEIAGHFDAEHSHRSAELEAIVGSFRFTAGVRPVQADTASTEPSVEAKGA